MLDALTAAAWKRPWGLIATALAALALLALVATGLRDHLGHPPGTSERSELTVVATSPEGTPRKVFDVALDVVRAKIASEPAVGDVTLARLPGKEGGAVLVVEMGGAGAAERRALGAELPGEIDPGPLEIRVGGRLDTLLDAEDSLLGDLWRLELLVVPLAILALVAGVGVRLAAGPALSAAIAVAGALALLVISGQAGDLSLLAVVPAAIVGMGLGVEFAALLARRWRDEVRLGEPFDALRRTLRDASAPILAAALAAALAVIAMVVPQAREGFDHGVALALGAILAAAVGAAAAVGVMAPLIALAGRRPHSEDADAHADERVSGALAALPRTLARGRLRCAAGAAAAVAVAVALAYPALDAETAELTASQGSTDALLGELPLAALAVAGLLGALLAARGRSWRLAPFAVSALLAPAAALGVATLVFSDGTKLFGLGVSEPGTMTTGAVATGLVALAAIAAARTAVALEAVRNERELDAGAAGVAERAAQLTLPAAAISTAIVASALGVLAAAELRAAQELGVIVAVGVVVDLVVVRGPVLAALARWGAPRRERGGLPRRARIPWPIAWRPRRKSTQTASPS